MKNDRTKNFREESHEKNNGSDENQLSNFVLSTEAEGEWKQNCNVSKKVILIFKIIQGKYKPYNLNLNLLQDISAIL